MEVTPSLTLTESMAANSSNVLTTNFGKPAALFERFPHKGVFIMDKRAPRE